MSYTISRMEDYNGMQQITLDKNGNKYLVGHYDKGTRKYTHKTFDTIAEAEAAFLRLASCFIRGDYSPEDRAEMLLSC